MVKKVFGLIYLISIISCSNGESRNELASQLHLLSKEGKYSLIKENRLAPDDTLVSLKGDKILLSEVQSEITVIDFWATWCSPCYKSIPTFYEYADRYPKDRVSFIVISIDEEYDFWKSEAVSNGWIDNSYWIGGEESNNSLFSLVLEQLDLDNQEQIVTALPNYAIITENGKIIANSTTIFPKSQEFSNVMDSLLAK